jgi:hypothetical protein
MARISNTEFPEREELDDVEPLLEALTLGKRWLRTKYEWSSGDCIYKGENEDLTAGDGDVDWWITKFDWVAGDCVEKRVRVASWNDRAIGW